MRLMESQIRSILKRKKWSYKKLADKLHNNGANVYRDLSRGQLSRARVTRLNRLAKALGVVFLPLFVKADIAKRIMKNLNHSSRA